MRGLFVCPKSKGNTYQVSRYLADQSHADLLVLSQNETIDLKKYNSIFLCSGIYGGNVHRNLLRWLEQIEKTSINKNAKFFMVLTWFGVGETDKKAMQEVSKLLRENKLSLNSDYVACYGGKIIVRHGHPNREDLEKILEWVRVRV